MKALVFLSSLVTDGVIASATATSVGTNGDSSPSTTTSFFIGCGICWIFVMVQLILFIPTHFQVNRITTTGTKNKWENGIYQFGPVVLVLKTRPGSASIPSSLFEIRMHSWAYLYVLALIASTFMASYDNFQIHKSIILAAPFLLVTGSLIILSCHQEDEDLFLNIVRRALQRSLIDVVQFVGEDIAEDDMLQLNMIQWIVDYWATRATTTSDSNDGNYHHGGSNSVGDSSHSHNPLTGRLSRSANSANSFTSPSPSTACTNNRHSNVNINTESTSNNATPQTNAQSSTQRPRTKIGVELPSFINIDERARPAVLSYKKAVGEFPPSRNICTILAVAKRCPAILLVSYFHFSGSLTANYITIILIPMMILEVMRTSEWINACYRAIEIESLRARDNNDNGDGILIQEGKPIHNLNEKGNMTFLPEDMEPMEILLSTDSHSPFSRGSSLQVWVNVQSSVIALESSLTAIKCVNTAKHATDVAFDVMSLAKLGLEVKDKGLPYGVSILAKDLFQFHLERSMKSNTCQSSPATEPQYQRQRGSYSKAAISLVNNGQMLSKNIVELIEDGKKEDNFLHPIVSGISNIFGKGWLWGKEEGGKDRRNSSSTLTTKDAGDQRGDDDNSTYQSGSNGKMINYGNSRILSDDLDEHEQTAIRKPDLPLVDMNYIEPEVTQNRSQDSSLSAQIRENDDEAKNKLKESELQETVSATIQADAKEGEQRIKINSSNPRQNEELQHSGVIQVDENDKSGLDLFGAGLAVLAGAVVGGIALAAKGGEDERQRKKESTNSASTVSIERLDDDE